MHCSYYACTAVLPGCVLPLSVRATMLPVYVLLLSVCAAALLACAPPLSVHAAMLSPAHCSRLNVVRCCLPARRPCPSVLRCRLRAHYSCPFRAVMRPEYRCIMCCCWHISRYRRRLLRYRLFCVCTVSPLMHTRGPPASSGYSLMFRDWKFRLREKNPSYFKIVHSEKRNQDTKQIAHRHWQASKHTPTHLLTFCVTLSHDQES